jgi:hypothetical protein
MKKFLMKLRTLFAVDEKKLAADVKAAIAVAKATVAEDEKKLAPEVVTVVEAEIAVVEKAVIAAIVARLGA